MLEEDGVESKKQFTVTSRGLIQELKPVLLKADEANKDTIAVAILRTGEEKNTRYTVREL